MQAAENRNFIDRISREWRDVEDRFTSIGPDIPDTLMLELTNACNLRCVMCRNATMKRKRGFMSMDLIDRSLSEAKKLGIKKVALYTTGESLMHSSFVEVVNKVKALGFYCYTTSNGLLLTEGSCVALINAGLDSIKISIDGANKREYEQIRIRGKWDRLLEKMALLRKARDDLNSTMKIYAGAVVTVVNENSVEQFKQVFGPYVDGIYLSPLVNQSGQLPEVYNKLKSDKVSVETAWKPCKMLWDRIVISYEGYITACCVDYELDLQVGHYSNTSLEEAWHSQKMQAWRRMHLDGDVSDMALCKTCNAPMIQQIEVLNKTNNIDGD